MTASATQGGHNKETKNYKHTAYSCL